MSEYIIIGIDFGTCHSKVAWATSKEPDQIHVVADWRSVKSASLSTEIVPTLIQYTETHPSVKWGFAVSHRDKAIQLSKFLLLEERHVPGSILALPEFKRAKRLQNRAKMDSTLIVADFLKKLWNCAIESVVETLPANTIAKTRFHIVVTLPDMWPYYGQRAMKNAMRTAGILAERPCGKTGLRFLTEPEATALALVSKRSQTSHGLGIGVGDILMVCVVGGATVELKSYEVEGKSPVVLKECVGGCSVVYGGLFLEQRFLNLIKKKAPSNGGLSEGIKRKILDKDWGQTILPQFSGQKKRYWPVALAHPSSSNRLSKAVSVNPAEMSEVFELLGEKVQALVKNQVCAVEEKCPSKKPKLVLLGGGLGCSPYVKRIFHDLLGRVTVVEAKDEKRQDATCRGSILHGTQSLGLQMPHRRTVTVASRIPRVHYGVKCRVPWRASRHKLADGIQDEISREWVLSNKIIWFIPENDIVSSETRVRRQISVYITDNVAEVTDQIFVSSETKLPSVADSSVSPYCTIKWQKTIGMGILPTMMNDRGQIYHHLEYEIEAHWDECAGVFISGVLQEQRGAAAIFTR